MNMKENNDEEQFLYEKYKDSIEKAKKRIFENKYKWTNEELQKGVNGEIEWDKIWADPFSYKILEELGESALDEFKNGKCTTVCLENDLSDKELRSAFPTK